MQILKEFVGHLLSIELFIFIVLFQAWTIASCVQWLAPLHNTILWWKTKWPSMFSFDACHCFSTSYFWVHEKQNSYNISTFLDIVFALTTMDSCWETQILLFPSWSLKQLLLSAEFLRCICPRVTELLWYQQILHHSVLVSSFLKYCW